MAESKDRSDLLSKVQDFCSSSDVEYEFERFAKEHADDFERILDISSKDEQPLDFHEAYLDYLKLFESKLERFLAQEGYSSREFYSECQEVLNNDNNSLGRKHRFFIEALMATTDYSTFFSLMKSEIHGLRSRSRSK